MVRVKLTRQNRIDGKAGEIVEVSTGRADFLFRFGLAEPVADREQIETPEEPKTTRKTTRKQKK